MKLNIQRAISWWEKKNRKLPNLHIRGIFDMLECCYDVILQGSICLTVIGYFLLYLSVATCPSTFKEIGHSVQFVGLSSDDLILSVCYVNGNQTLLNLYDVPTLGSSVCCTVAEWYCFVAQFCQLFVLFCFTIMICFILHFSMYLAPFDKLFVISEHIKCQVWWHNSYKWCRYTLFRTKFQVCK